MKKNTAVVLFVFLAGVVAVLVTLSHALSRDKQMLASHTLVLGTNESIHESEAVVSASEHVSVSSSLPTPFQIQQHLPLSFLFEIFKTSHYKEELSAQLTTSYRSPFIKALLRRIISPKGP